MTEQAPVQRRPVAVVVATKDRPALLADCLASIAADVRTDDELVVAEAGNSEAAVALACLDRKTVHVELHAGGKSRQLNAALARCLAPIILFTDDDCRIPAGWADAMTAPFEDDPAVAIAFGPVVGLSHHPGSTPMAGPPPGEAPLATWTFAHGAAMAVRRSALSAIGGFDERLGPGAPAHGEEHDVLLRLRERGYRAVVAPAPAVEHLDWRDEEQNLANVMVYQRGSGAFLGAAMRRAPRPTWPLLKLRMSFQRAIFGGRGGKDWKFGARALAAFGRGFLYGLRLRPGGGAR